MASSWCAIKYSWRLHDDVPHASPRLTATGYRLPPAAYYLPTPCHLPADAVMVCGGQVPVIFTLLVLALRKGVLPEEHRVKGW